MFSQSFNFTGYYPAYNAEQLGKAKDELAVVDGQNFAWQLAGIRSYYANSIINAPTGSSLMAHPLLFVIDGQLHYFDAAGVWALSKTNVWSQAFSFAGAPAFTNDKGYDLTQYKWTTAFVGTRYWFCHPAVGLVYYDLYTSTWGFYRDNCWYGPVFAIALATNRLVILMQDALAWSKFDDGSEFVYDDWHHGSGVQSLVLLEYGQPYSVQSYGGGWITFTSTGVLVSRPNGDVVGAPDGQSVAPGALMFHHSVVTQEDIPLGPCACCNADRNTVIWLTQKGFRTFAQSQGGGWGASQEWQPEMSAFYREFVLPASKSRALDRFCIDVAKDCGWVFVSSRPNDTIVGYSRAHVFQPEVSKWGSFDWRHLTVGQSRRTDVVADIGWVDQGGRLHYVDEVTGGAPSSWIRFSPMRLQMPTDPSLPPTTVTATQDWRLGIGHSPWTLRSPLGLLSSWEGLKQPTSAPLPATKAKYYAYGGWDTGQANLTEKIELMPVTVGSDSIHLVGTTTGINHSFVVAADTADEAFFITSLEIGYVFAGFK